MTKLFLKEIGVDMGSAHTRIGSLEQGLILCEPTVAAIQIDSGQPIAAGIAAIELIKYAPERYRSIYPVKNGLISDCMLVSYILRKLLRKACVGMGGLMHSLEGTFSVPCGLGDQDYMAWEYCAAMAGIRKVQFVEESLAAALSEGWDVYKPYGRMAISLGAGDIRAAVMSFSGISAYHQRKTGGTYLDGLIVRYIADTYGLQINMLAAEQIKQALSIQDTTEQSIHIFGKQQEGNKIEEVYLHPAEFAGVLQLIYKEILEIILELFKEISPELLGDISQDGILLYGGNALLYGLKSYLEEKTGLTIQIASSPFEAVLRGVCMAKYWDEKPSQSWMA